MDSSTRLILVSVMSLLVFGSAASGAIMAGAADTGTSDSFAVNVAAGDDRALLVFVNARGASDPNISVTFTGSDTVGYDMSEAITFVQEEGGFAAFASIYYLAAPAEGAGTVDIAGLGGEAHQHAAVTFYGVDQSTVIGNVASWGDDAEDANVSVTLSDLTAGSWIASAMEYNYAAGANSRTPTTESNVDAVLYSFDSGNGRSAGGYTLVDEPVETLTWHYEADFGGRASLVAAEVLQVPEPATLSLLGLGALAALRRRRR